MKVLDNRRRRTTKKRKTWILFGLLVCVVALMVTCKKKQKVVQEPVRIPIGLVVYSDEGVERDSTLNAAAMAVDKTNKDGGFLLDGKPHVLEVHIEEVRGAVPEESIAAVVRLINQKQVVAIIGPQYSIDAIPAGAVAESASVPLISPISTSPCTTADRKYVFRMGFLDDFQGQAAASFCYGELGIKKAAVIYNIAEPYSRGIAEVFKVTFEKLGGLIVAFESFITGQDNYQAQLEWIKRSDAGLLFLPTFSEDAERVALQARQLGIPIPLMGADGWDRQYFKTLKVFDGCYMIAHWISDIDLPAAQVFVSEFRSRFNLEPGDPAALTFDAFNLVVAAIRSVDAYSPDLIRDAIYAMGPLEGVTGEVDFIDRGDPDKAAVVLKFKEGAVLFEKLVKP